MKRSMALTLVLAILLSAFSAAAVAEEAPFAARTTLNGSSDEKVGNICLAAAALNGLTVGYGETFSFNEAVGPRTKANGYVRAENARGAQIVGGGVSQVATTLYLALLEIDEGGVVFDELTTYGSRFADNYVPDGSLAVTTDYSAGTDFRFTNYAADALMMEFHIVDGELCCVLTALDTGALGVNTWTFSCSGDFFLEESQTAVFASLDSGGDPAVLANVNLAADSIYDTTLTCGDVFSFNTVVGPRSERYGFCTAVNGRGVEVTGGGVAQVASVIWLAIKQMDDVSIVEKSTYGGRYNQSYVENSADAILTDYNAGTDFAFRYNGSGSMTIYTYTDGSMLYCEIYRNN